MDFHVFATQETKIWKFGVRFEFQISSFAFK